MAKTVGLSRNIKLQWLNKAVELLNNGLGEAEYKQALNEYLSFEIGSATNLRKTREILMNIWFYESEETDSIRKEGLSLIQELPDHALAVHWCMMQATYPVFFDLCKMIGRIAEFQDEITLSVLKQKLFDEWGERTTLSHSTDKIISTMKDFDVINCQKPGKYKISRHTITNDKIVCFVVWVAMKLCRKSYCSFSELTTLDGLFPFEYKVNKEQIMSDPRFVISNFGGETSVALNEK